MSHAMTRITTSERAARQDMVSMRTASKLRVILKEREAAAKCLLTRSCQQPGGRQDKHQQNTATGNKRHVQEREKSGDIFM